MNTRILIGACALLSLAAVAHAQSAAPAPGVAPASGSTVPPPALVLPVSPATDPLASPEPAQAVPAATSAPPAAPETRATSPKSRALAVSTAGLDRTALLSDDDLTREVARIRARIEVLDADQDLLQAQAAHELQRLQNELARRKLLDEMAGVGQDKTASTGTSASPSGVVVAVPVEVLPVVRSIYGYDGQSFAEIYVGGAKIIATEGTVLATGHRVVAIGPSGVELLRKGRRSVLHVAGSAGINPISPAGLPPSP